MFGRTRPKASKNAGRETSRCYFDVDNVQMYFEYSDILDVITQDSCLEDVIQTYDGRHGTDFWPHLYDNAIALYRNRLDRLPDWTRGSIEVRSWSEALVVASAVPRVRMERNGRLLDLFLDDSSGDVKKDVARYDRRHGTDFVKRIEAGDVRIVPYVPDEEVAFPVVSWEEVLSISDRRRRA